MSFLRDYLSWLSFKASILATDHLILDKFEVIYFSRLSVGVIKGTNTHPSLNTIRHDASFFPPFSFLNNNNKKNTLTTTNVMFVTVTNSDKSQSRHRNNAKKCLMPLLI